MRAAIATIFAAAVAAELDPFDVIPLTQLARRVGAADPEQIYVAVGNSSDSVVITWITSTSGTDTSVEYGPTSTFGSTATGTAGSYKIGSYTSGEIKTVHVTGLSPAQTYYYRVGGASGWSPMYSFTSNSVGPSFPYPLAVMGDPGQTTNSNSTFTHVASSKARSFLITGDLSYADGDQPRWDTFQRLIQPLATGMISGLVTGNHDEETSGGQSYVAYNARWTMPYLPEFASSTKSVFYSYEVGPVHVIVLASFVAFTASSPQDALGDRGSACTVAHVEHRAHERWPDYAGAVRTHSGCRQGTHRLLRPRARLRAHMPDDRHELRGRWPHVHHDR